MSEVVVVRAVPRGEGGVLRLGRAWSRHGEEHLQRRSVDEEMQRLRGFDAHVREGQGERGDDVLGRVREGPVEVEEHRGERGRAHRRAASRPARTQHKNLRQTLCVAVRNDEMGCGSAGHA